MKTPSTGWDLKKGCVWQRLSVIMKANRAILSYLSDQFCFQHYSLRLHWWISLRSWVELVSHFQHKIIFYTKAFSQYYSQCQPSTDFQCFLLITYYRFECFHLRCNVMTCFRRLGSRVGRQLIFQKWHPGKVMHEMQEIHFKSAFFCPPQSRPLDKYPRTKQRYHYTC